MTTTTNLTAVHAAPSSVIATAGVLSHALPNVNPPSPMGDAAFHGIAGKAVKAIAPFTEADPHGILLALLCLAGNRIGRGVQYAVPGGGAQFTNEYVAIVGATGLARKSTAWDVISGLWRHVEPEFADSDTLCAGISSGEALIERLQDKPAAKTSSKDAPDKRLIVYLDEFGTLFEVIAREGNSLGELMKTGFGGGPLQLMVKGNRQKASQYHLSVVAATTMEQVRSAFSASSHRKLRTRTSDGFTNRFLWVLVKRAQKKSRISQAERDKLAAILSKFGTEFATVLSEVACSKTMMDWDEDAGSVWDEWYNSFEIPAGMDGYLGRGEQHVIRLAMTYASLDGAKAIQLPHLEAALEVWRYCSECAQHIFSTAAGDSYDSSVRKVMLRARLLERLAPAPGMTKAQVHKALGNNLQAAELNSLLSELEAAGSVAHNIDESTHPPTVRYWRIGDQLPIQ